ncbi:PD-(D/E)XK nuclease family protein [Pyrococcus kukulkanii]|uniref:PD-(D/E)XK nuclease family protein n=1 Tax=Pyrococcus kukulkanii TaxID=1609559 RepID=UPI003563065A
MEVADWKKFLNVDLGGKKMNPKEFAEKISFDPEDLPEEIKSYMEEVLGSNREEFLKDYLNDDIIHVTEAVGCLRKAFIVRYLIKKGVEFSEKNWAIFRGKLWDRILSPLFENNQKPIMIAVKDEYGTFFIKGVYDAVVDDVVIDFKTVGSHQLSQLPKEHHVRQIYTYAVAMNKKPVLIYISNKSPAIVHLYHPERLEAAKKIYEETIERAKKLHRALKGNRVPEKERSGLCNYCPFAEFCDLIRTTKDIDSLMPTFERLFGGGGQ